MIALLLASLSSPCGAAPLNQPALPPDPGSPAETPHDVPSTLAAHLVVDAKVPVEILLGGHKLGELFYPSKAQFDLVAPITTTARLYTSGVPTDVPVDLKAGETLRILVGKTGVTADKDTSHPDSAQGPFPLELRLVGGGGAMVRIDDKRHVLGSSGRLQTELPAGRHTLSVRSEDGTVIWAAGDLLIDGPLVMQITEGRLPELSGQGSFIAGG